MSINPLNTAHFPVFKNLLSCVNNKVRIASPFIGFETAKYLANFLSMSLIKCTIITRFYREDFLSQVSSLDGLKLLLGAGVEIYALNNLHSKLYIFDEETAIMGSANFTMGGFIHNHELSLVMKNEYALIQQLVIYYDGLVNRIQQNGPYCLDLRMIDDEIDIIDKIVKNRNNKNVNFSNNHKHGADLEIDDPGFDAGFEENNSQKAFDPIEDLLHNDEYQVAGSGNNIWLKFVNSGDNRHDPNKRYSLKKLQSNNKYITSFPRKPSGIGNGDYIYLAAVSEDDQGHYTPMIIARVRTCGYNANYVASNADILQYGWLQDYPYYVELYDIEILNASVKNGISLDSIIRGLGSDLYPTTQGHNLSIPELKTRHHQKSHLKITSVAKNYIDTLFNGKVKQYGLIL
jgi:hypothetical protein